MISQSSIKCLQKHMHSEKDAESTTEGFINHRIINKRSKVLRGIIKGVVMDLVM